MEQNDFQELINHSHIMAENLLIKQDGEFYPFGATINNEGILTHIGHYDGDEFPLSKTKIEELKKFFEKEIADEKIRAYAIAFDCLTKRDDNSEKTDAIAIECYSKENEQRTIYYFPYRRHINNELEFGEAWGIMLE